MKGGKFLPSVASEMGFRVLCIILLNLLSGNRPYCSGWFACGERLAIGWSSCFAFSTFVRAALPGSNGAGVPSICFAKTRFWLAAFRSPRPAGKPDSGPFGLARHLVRTCVLYCSIAAAVRPVPPTHTTRTLPAGPRGQYNRRVRARSSVDRAPASGAGCGSSSLPGRTICSLAVSAGPDNPQHPTTT